MVHTRKTGNPLAVFSSINSLDEPFKEAFYSPFRDHVFG